jgi:mono-ADP-ribosyltransferase sirtuin 6
MASRRFPEPELVNASNELARPDMGTDIDASEYRDSEEVLAAKIDVLAQLIQASERCCAYTGAGLSTSAGIGDYASKAKGSAVKRWDPKADDGPHMEWLKEMRPTRGHRVLAGLERAGYLKEWINQNHDGLAMKATFPLAKLNEIHGSWFDGRNPVVAMGGSMRRDLTRRLETWSESADLVLALGTSLSGLYADCVAESAAARWREERGAVRAGVQEGTAPTSTGEGETGQASGNATTSVGGLVIVSLTKTPLDGAAALRIYATLDEVLGRLADKLGLERRGMLPTDAEVASASKRSALWRAYAVWYRDVHDPMHKRETPTQIMRRAQPTNR